MRREQSPGLKLPGKDSLTESCILKGVGLDGMVKITELPSTYRHATADKGSYGFRPYRSCHDAIERCYIHLSRCDSATWILEGDIKGCFDNISHQWFIENIPMDKKSMTLDGLEAAIDKAFGITIRTDGCRKNNPYKIHLVRYADDFVVTATDKETLETKVKPLIEGFLTKRGLQLSSEKTKITHITEGFDFLGQNIRMYSRNKLVIRPSKDSIMSVKNKLKEIIVKHRGSQAAVLIRNLNPVITGWANYHRHICAKKIFYNLDRILWRNIWNWARRRHNNLGYRKIVSLLFMRIGNRKWQFFGKFNDGRTILLRMFACFRIKRHRLINGNANPFDTAWDNYFTNRLKLKYAT